MTGSVGRTDRPHHYYADHILTVCGPLGPQETAQCNSVPYVSDSRRYGGDIYQVTIVLTESGNGSKLEGIYRHQDRGYSS